MDIHLSSKDLTSCITSDLFQRNPTGGSTTSSLRQFRKKDVDKSHGDQSQKQAPDAHVARVAPHNHYPPGPNDCYRYPSHQFPDYSSPAKYSDTPETSQSNLISTSVIQKPKPKDYMDMCNAPQPHMKPTYPDHLANHQQYHHENAQYMHKDPHPQIHPNGFKAESPFFAKEQHQYQQMHGMGGSSMQPKFNQMMVQNMKKYGSTPTPSENPFLNKLSKIRPSMARSIISDHHLQDTQGNYQPVDQRSIYPQQNPRYYPGPMYQQNQYSPTPTYPMNTSHYPNYPASCSYPRSNQMAPMAPRFHPMDRSMSPTRRGYPENMHMSHMNCHSMPQKMISPNNYPPQYGGPEYSQHYQHRRVPQEMFPQGYRPPQYIQNHHQMAVSAQDMQDMSESRVSPSDSLKKFIENWAEEEPNPDMSAMENPGLRDNMKLRDDSPAGTVFMINATDVQYFENNGIPLVTSDNGGIQLTSENYQYLLKDGMIDSVVRIVEPNGNNERVVNVQILDPQKPDCMMTNKNCRPKELDVVQQAMKGKEENKKVVIHQNTVINSPKDILPIQQNMGQVSLHQAVIESINASKELVDKNCSPINLDELDHNNDYKKSDENKDSNEQKDTLLVSDGLSDSDALDDTEVLSPNKSPELKSMPIIDIFAESHLVSTKICEESEETSLGQEETNIVTNLSEEIKPNVDENFQQECKEKLKNSIDNIDDHNAKALNNNGSSTSSNHKEIAISFDDLIESKPEEILDYKVSDNAEPTDEAIKNLDEQTTTFIPKKEEASTLQTNEVLKNSNDVSEKVSENCLPKHEEIKMCEDNNETVETNVTNSNVSPPVGKRKRIFSVDDIIYNIGNFTKKPLMEIDNICSIEMLNSFLQHEVEYSSLQQLLILDEAFRESKENIVNNMSADNDRESIRDSNEVLSDFVEIPVEVISKPTDGDDLEKANTDSDGKTQMTILDSSSSSSLSHETQQGEEIATKHKIDLDKPMSSPYIMELLEERVASPGDIQYRRAITVEESSVLLQIAGELMEISINVVNGKRLITVVPISDSTEVDCNDNYEVSNNIDNNNVESEEKLKETLKCSNNLENTSEMLNEMDVSTLLEEDSLENSMEVAVCGKDKLQEEITTEMDSVNDANTNNILNSCSTISILEETKVVEEEVLNDENLSEILHLNESITNPQIEDLGEMHPELLEYPVDAEEILVSDELAHEVVVSDPLEGIGDEEEIEKPESISLQLEPVTTTEVVTVAVDQEIKDADNTYKSPQHLIQETSDSTREDNSGSLFKQNLAELSDQEQNHIKIDSPSTICLQKTVKPEVLILSPTSTNLDDNYATSKDNVYVEIKEMLVDNETCLTTKAAKKCYDTDLQIPSVTTSGDVSTTLNKKPANNSHDTVSSSKKEKDDKESHKLNKITSRQPKRNNDKINVKKEHRRTTSEKIKNKKDTSHVKEVKKKHTDSLGGKDKTDEVKNTEPEDEYIEFKELLKARKLKKEKKLQEMKIKEGKIGLNVEDSCNISIPTEQKCGEVSSSHTKENLDKSRSGCEGNSYTHKTIKHSKESKQKIKKPKQISMGSALELVKKSSSESSNKTGESMVVNDASKSNINDNKPQELSVNATKSKEPSKRVSFSDESPTSTSLQSLDCVKEIFDKQKSEKATESDSSSTSYQNPIPGPSVSELIEDSSSMSKKKISFLDYLRRKRKESSNDSNKNESVEEEKLLDSDHTKTNEEQKNPTLKILNDDWEDTLSPRPQFTQSSDECLIRDFSGLITNSIKKPVVDVNELMSLENPPDTKLQEYKETVDSKLNSLNIQIPKHKQHERRSPRPNVPSYESSETSLLIKRFLQNERMSSKEIQKIKQIILYKRFIQEQKKSTLSNNLTSFSNPSTSGQAHEVRNENKLEAMDPLEMKLHLKKVSAKRKLEGDSDEEDLHSVNSDQSEKVTDKKVDYSVYNRLGKDGLPKMIFKRNRQSNVSDDCDALQPIVKLERINLDKVKEKYNVTLTNTM